MVVILITGDISVGKRIAWGKPDEDQFVEDQFVQVDDDGSGALGIYSCGDAVIVYKSEVDSLISALEELRDG